MEEFKVESEGSILGLIIKIIVFSILITNVFGFFEKFIGQHPMINWILILGTVAYFVYGHFTDKTILTIKDNKLSSESQIGFPKKRDKKDFDLKTIDRIRLIQTHNFIYGKKKMELFDKNGDKHIIELKLRYYQLAKLQKFLKEQLKIKTSLVG